MGSWTNEAQTRKHAHSKSISERMPYLNGLFGVRFLNHTNGGVGNQDEKNDNGLYKGRSSVVLLQHGQHKRDGGSNEKNDDELVLELLENHLPERGRVVLGEFCFPIFKVDKKGRSDPSIERVHDGQ